MSETDVKRAVIDALNASGLCKVWSTPSGLVKVSGAWMHLAPEGTPDICGYARDGRFVGIEVKKPGHKTKPARAAKQAEARADILRRGGIAGQVESAHEAMQILIAAFNPQPKANNRETQAKTA